MVIFCQHKIIFKRYHSCLFYSLEVPSTRHRYSTKANIQLRVNALEQANCEPHEEIFTLRDNQERQAVLTDTLIPRLELIPTTPLSTTVSLPIVSNTTIPTTTFVTTAATTDFGMSYGFPYPFGHPYGPPYGYQGFIPPPEVIKGFPNDPFSSFGPFSLFGSQPFGHHPWLLIHSLRKQLCLRGLFLNTMVPTLLGLNFPCPWETLAIPYHPLLWLLSLFKRILLICIMARASIQTLPRT